MKRAHLTLLSFGVLLSSLGCGNESASSPPSAAAGSGGKSGAGGSGARDAGGGSGGGGDGGGGSGGVAGSASGAGGVGGASGGTGGGGGGAGAPSVCPKGMSFGNPLPAGVSATPVGSGYEFLEGPVWFAERGVLFFSNMMFSGGGSDGVPPSVIYELKPPNTFAPFISSIGSNGLAIDAAGQLVACTHDTRTVSRFDLGTKMRSTLADAYMGKKFSSPNDAIVRSDGTLYFTDPNWQLGNRTQEIQFKGVYRVPPGGSALLVSDALSSPNGIGLSPDETKLYVTDDGTGRVHRFAVSSDGSTISEAQPLATVNGADGMAVDCAGNLYVTSHEGIRVLDANGGNIGTLTVAEKPNNCTFGGSDRTTLYIAGRATLFSVKLAVPGLP